MKKVLLIIFIVLNLHSSEIYFLPESANHLKEKIRYEISTAKESIFLAMYNFSYKSIAKDLVKASKNGTKITILLDKSKVSENDEVYDILKDSNIKIVLYDEKKMHLKLMLFDNKLAMLGSLNFTKKSFQESLDMVYFTKDFKLLTKLKDFVAKFE